MVREEFQLNYFQAGLLASGFALAYGFAQLPIGAFSERLGQRRVIMAGLLGTSLAGIAAGFTGNYNQLLVCLVLMGLFGSSYHAPSSSFLSRSFSRERRGQILGMHLIGGNLSFLVTPFLAVLIASLSGTWRSAFTLLALPALAASIVLWATVPGGGGAEDKLAVGFSEDGFGWRAILRAIGLLLGGTMLVQLITFSIYSFLPLYLIDKHGVSFQQAGVLTGVMVGVGIVGSPLGGGLSDRIGRGKVILFSLISAGPLLYLLTVVPMGLWFLSVLVVFGMTMSFRVPATESLIADHVSGPRRTMALATYYFFSQETSSVMTPVVGRLIDHNGMDPVFKGLALVACVISVGMLGKLRRDAQMKTEIRASSLGGVDE
jgi:MFS family permease